MEKTRCPAGRAIAWSMAFLLSTSVAQTPATMTSHDGVRCGQPGHVPTVSASPVRMLCSSLRRPVAHVVARPLNGSFHAQKRLATADESCPRRRAALLCSGTAHPVQCRTARRPARRSSRRFGRGGIVTAKIGRQPSLRGAARHVSGCGSPPAGRHPRRHARAAAACGAGTATCIRGPQGARMSI